VTTGKDRPGHFPTSPNEIKERVRRLGTLGADVVIVEIGGTVGDIEIVPFIESIRQFRRDAGRDNVCYVHLTSCPTSHRRVNRRPSRPKHSVTELRSRGIQPDVIVCRSDQPLSDGLKRKISLLCDVPMQARHLGRGRTSIYDIPITMHNEGLDTMVCNTLGIDLDANPIDLSAWREVVRRVHSTTKTLRHRGHWQIRNDARRVPLGRRVDSPRRFCRRRQDRYRMVGG